MVQIKHPTPRNSYVIIGALFIVTGSMVTASDAQTTLNASQLALRSQGTAVATTQWRLNQNGFVGTYITLTEPGEVTLGIRATGESDGGVFPRMNLAVNNMRSGWTVGTAAATYTQTLSLPAGTHMVRVEYANDPFASSSRRLTVQDLYVTGAGISNINSNANALAAADTYITHYRRGRATLDIRGAADGTPVSVRLREHDFRFGTAVPGTSTSSVNTFVANNPSASSTAGQFQNALRTLRFNSITPENAGKWANNEATQNILTMGGLDRMRQFATANGLRMRGHNLIWGSQQPTYINNLLASAATDQSAREQLDAEIEQRIQYYVRDRALHHDQLDVYNESFHTTQYLSAIGDAGVAEVYNAVALAATQGGNARLKRFVNEYNVLAETGNDAYANWYRQHVQRLQSAGAGIDGIGVQYYANNNYGTAFNQHSPARIAGALANLSVLGLDLELTEFGVKPNGAGSSDEIAARAATVLTDTLRLVFGSPQATGMTLWGFWAGSIWADAPAGALYDLHWNLTPAGEAYLNLMNGAFDTRETGIATAGTFDWTGFYGTYDVMVGDQMFTLKHEPGAGRYVLIVPEPTAFGWMLIGGGLLVRRRSRTQHRES